MTVWDPDVIRLLMALIAVLVLAWAWWYGDE